MNLPEWILLTNFWGKSSVAGHKLNSPSDQVMLAPTLVEALDVCCNVEALALFLQIHGIKTSCNSDHDNVMA